MPATTPPSSRPADIDAIERGLLRTIADADDRRALEQVRVAALGRKGDIARLMASLADLPEKKRADAGKKFNGLKDRLQAALAAREGELRAAERKAELSARPVDVSLPVSAAQTGRIHPVSHVLEEVTGIFAELGFSVEEGPDIETDHYNFTALNMPAAHPARAMHDTFYFEPHDGEQRLLRTHTSPVQIRTMEKREPPLRFVSPGRTYRRDSDQTHTPMFHQIEGLAVDGETHMGHLKWVLREFVRAFFDLDDVAMRFRPSFFPFTEPSAEVDVRCTRKGGEIRVGDGDQWLEILGCGMIHPNVLKNCGIDPDRFQGFAFGVGLDRLAMLKYGIPDLRSFFDADLRWLSHYGFRPLDTPSRAVGPLP